MKAFTPGLFDRLLGVPQREARLTAEDLKDIVARDLEALLNTRSVLDEAVVAERPAICSCIEKTIACHEPRLRNVKAALELREESVNRLSFSITALLVASLSEEAVNFDAVLQPSTLQYSIKKTGRAKPQHAAARGA